MSPNPQHGTPTGDAIIALGKLARQTGGDVQELMTLYALEGLLARIAPSEYRDDFVLKGGVLLAAFAARRPTKDIDLQATRLTDDPDEVAERVRAIAGLELADGLIFDPASVTAATIRDEDEYAGVRVKLIATLGTARLTVGMDVNFGDPIWPTPELIELPRVTDLGLPSLTLLGYPLTMVLAERSSPPSTAASLTLAGATLLTSTLSPASTPVMQVNSAHRSKPSPSTARSHLHRCCLRLHR